MNLQIRNFLRGPYTLFDPETGTENVFETAVPHKWLPGDIVLPTGEVRARGGTTHRSIVGIVDFCNRTGQGFTPRGVPLYLFHPLDSGYPPFLVSAKTRPASNMLALVNYEHWDGKWPRGGIHAMLGAVGDKRVEKQALRIAAQVGALTGTAADLPTLLTPIISGYDDRPWDIVCNIDPEGCEDVDDVFAWRADGTFAIGIADVSAFVDEGSALDVTARAKGTSVYENTVVVDPMLPAWLSSGTASLLADGVVRPVLALVWSPTAGEPEWRRLLLTVNRRHSYESVLKDSEVCLTLPTLLTRVLGACDRDPHEWVAAAMVEYNRRAGDLLAGAGLGLLRVHCGAASAENAALAAATGCRALAWRGAAAGFYVAATSPVAAHGHAGLGLSAYAHATSPLRRYADLVNQRALKHVLGYYRAPPAGSMAELAFQLNARARVVREYELRAWFLSALRTDALTTAEAICCEFRGPPVDAWTVYVPAWRRFVYARPADGVFPTAGQVVRVRAFCDLREVVWDRRCVCQITGPK